MRYYVVDAFAERLFSGNPAGVCLLDRALDDALMQQIAAENNLSETAFALKDTAGYRLRWFTPETEIDLCGHATLATAFVLLNFIETEMETVSFHTMSGPLSVRKNGELYELDFPSRPPKPVDILPVMEEAIGTDVLEAHRSRDMLLLVAGEEQVREMAADMERIRQIPSDSGVIVTAKGNDADFVSRYFAPNEGIPEDPVTGSAHSTLIPFWKERLGKDKMVARQLSSRGGTLYCQACGDRVKIAGRTALYLTGELNI